MIDHLLSEYLDKNHSIISNRENSIEDLSLLDDDLKDNEIFLAGENHGVKANTELRIKFLEYFKEKINFKYYLCEFPYSMTHFLNKYLETGDEGILSEIYIALKGTDAWNDDDYNHWKKLYDYNSRFSREDRIIAVGIDIEHQPKNAFKFMESILDDRENMEKINNYIKLYNDSWDSLKDEEIRTISLDIKRELIDNENIYRDSLGGDYFKVVYVNNNLLNMLEVYSGNNFNGIRDLKMYENFIEIYRYLPKDKYFGQIGLSHIFKKTFPYVDWFASSLNSKGSEFRDKVISIAYAYRDCKYLYPTTRKNYISTMDTLDSSIEEFDLFLKDKLILFKLNGLNSPFSRELIWPLVHKLPDGGVTSDYIDYLVVAKDSREMTAFKEDFRV